VLAACALSRSAKADRPQEGMLRFLPDLGDGAPLDRDLFERTLGPRFSGARARRR
jgi:hypothetical protein